MQKQEYITGSGSRNPLYGGMFDPDLVFYTDEVWLHRSDYVNSQPEQYLEKCKILTLRSWGCEPTERCGHSSFRRL
jgi:hypothetical protein